MKVYVVISKGDIFAVYKDKKEAEKAKAFLYDIHLTKFNTAPIDYIKVEEHEVQ